MAYLSDIEIAQACKMRPIYEIAAKAGIPEEYVEPYGKYKAKIDLAMMRDESRKRERLKPGNFKEHIGRLSRERENKRK